ncbi:hypothetical protein L2E82_02345 [Cichorium intybus]|uniref:Uncharacterized protein n=1 Tax=Cichorium intybus TaxID=13427 RepID=A0ACB9H219_CICIN|nr:hypothetical protein L2E82_02345 [Cichorium intybus]
MASYLYLTPQPQLPPQPPLPRRRSQSYEKSKGYGFVMYKHIDGALMALKEPNKQSDGRMTVSKLHLLDLQTRLQSLRIRKPWMYRLGKFTFGIYHTICPERGYMIHFSSYGDVVLGFDKPTDKSKSFLGGDSGGFSGGSHFSGASYGQTVGTGFGCSGQRSPYGLPTGSLRMSSRVNFESATAHYSLSSGPAYETQPQHKTVMPPIMRVLTRGMFQGLLIRYK